VATVSRLLQIIGLYCKRALSKRRYSAKETCNFEEPTNRSNPIGYVERLLDKIYIWGLHSNHVHIMYMLYVFYVCRETTRVLCYICKYIYICIECDIGSLGKSFVFAGLSWERDLHTNTYNRGWLRSVGSMKLLVCFAEYCLFYRALMQK